MSLCLRSLYATTRKDQVVSMCVCFCTETLHYGHLKLWVRWNYLHITRGLPNNSYMITLWWSMVRTFYPYKISKIIKGSTQVRSNLRSDRTERSYTPLCHAIRNQAKPSRATHHTQSVEPQGPYGHVFQRPFHTDTTLSLTSAQPGRLGPSFWRNSTEYNGAPGERYRSPSTMQMMVAIYAPSYTHTTTRTETLHNRACFRLSAERRNQHIQHTKKS